MGDDILKYLTSPCNKYTYIDYDYFEKRRVVICTLTSYSNVVTIGNNRKFPEMFRKVNAYKIKIETRKRIHVQM